MTQQGILKLRFIPYNARLIDARKEKGWTQQEFSDLTGIRQSTYSAVETLRIMPTTEMMEEIACALNCTTEYLFPNTLLEAMRDGLFKNRVTYLKEQKLVRLIEAEQMHLLESPEDEWIKIADQNLVKCQLMEVIGTLKEREQKVLMMRFGLNGLPSQTLEQVGRIFGLSRERIAQIERKALRILRHPTRARKLKDLLG